MADYRAIRSRQLNWLPVPPIGYVLHDKYERAPDKLAVGSVICDGTIVYGPPHGYARCGMSDGKATSASDPKPADGDPAVAYFAAQESIELWTPDWRVEMQVQDTGKRDGR